MRKLFEYALWYYSQFSGATKNKISHNSQSRCYCHFFSCLLCNNLSWNMKIINTPQGEGAGKHFSTLEKKISLFDRKTTDLWNVTFDSVHLLISKLEAIPPPLGHSFVGNPVFVSQGCLNFHSKNSVRLNCYSSRTQHNAMPSPQIWNYIPSPGANSTNKQAFSQFPHWKQQRAKIMRAQNRYIEEGQDRGKRVTHHGMER